jgi:hypothetical protein
MFKKINKPKNKTKKDSGNKPAVNDYGAVVLERIEGQIKLVAEGHGILEGKIGLVGDKVDSMESEMRSSFITVLNYLSRMNIEMSEIRTEIKKINEYKADKRKMNILEQKIIHFELELNECKKIISAKNN